MTIEKYQGSFAKEDFGCTISVNETIQSIKDVHTLAIYSYLLTKPNTWNINVVELQHHFSIGRDVARRSINNLIELKLLRRTQVREHGKFLRYHYELFLKPHASIESSPETDFPAPVKKDTYKTKITSLENKEKDIISDFDKSPTTVTDDQIVEAYHEVLPDCPKIRILDKSFKNQIKLMRANWPKYQQDGQQFTIESFKRYLLAVKQTNPGFLKPYTTSQGNKRQNNLRTLTREINIARLLNGELDFSTDRG